MVESVQTPEQVRAEFREKQMRFAQLYGEFLTQGKLELVEEGSQLVKNKFLMNTAKVIQGQNLEDLNDLARDYLV